MPPRAMPTTRNVVRFAHVYAAGPGLALITNSTKTVTATIAARVVGLAFSRMSPLGARRTGVVPAHRDHPERAALLDLGGLGCRVEGDCRQVRVLAVHRPRL